MIVDIWIFGLVDLLCYQVGYRTVSEYGQTLLVAALGAAVIGVLEVIKSAELSWVQKSGHAELATRRGAGNRLRKEYVARANYHFFWLMVAVAAVAFLAGMVMQFGSLHPAFLR